MALQIGGAAVVGGLLASSALLHSVDLGFSQASEPYRGLWVPAVLCQVAALLVGAAVAASSPFWRKARLAIFALFTALAPRFLFHDSGAPVGPGHPPVGPMPELPYLIGVALIIVVLRDPRLLSSREPWKRRSAPIAALHVCIVVGLAAWMPRLVLDQLLAIRQQVPVGGTGWWGPWKRAPGPA